MRSMPSSICLPKSVALTIRAISGATNNNYTEFDKLDKNRVCGIKLFMGSSTGNMLVDKMNSLLNIFNGTDLLIA